MELRWTASEEELLISLVHSSSCGRPCRKVRTWTEIANLMNERALDLGVKERTYPNSDVAYYYAQIPKAQLEQGIEKLAANPAETSGSNGRVVDSLTKEEM